MDSYKLVVVESPNKIEKVEKCLGPGFRVVATVGHFRDLPEGELGVDLASFEPLYEVMPTKSHVVPRLRSAAANASEVLLATDADREGEAIAWHVAQSLGLKSPRRMRFQEITSAALQRAVSEASALDVDLVDAQQARRVLDRLVGYQVSPLLRVFGPNHSAGRVQSAALHLVTKRELEREKFTSVPFWTLSAVYEGFSAKTALRDGAGVWVPAHYSTQESASAAKVIAESAVHTVEDISTKSFEQAPKPPFTTSTLQQAASAQLDLAPDRTMVLAQGLFEKGLISYHRTDSVALSAEAVAMARDFIVKEYPDALPEVPPKYRSGASAQEAHEAIRPTHVQFDAAGLSSDEEALLSLINCRFLASQCRPAKLARTTLRIAVGEVRFLAYGDVVTLSSFLKFMSSDEEETASKEDEPQPQSGVRLPLVRVGENLRLTRLDKKADKTKPAPRFTQATLIREMEKTGIGRPSTFSNSVKTLFDRAYIQREKKSVVPTLRGRLVDGAVASAFPTLVEAEYTSQMESRLDDVAAGRRRWKDELRAWHGAFSRHLEGASSAMQAWANANKVLVDQTTEAPKATGKPCPKCGKELFIRQGKKGAFLACSGYPACTYSADPSAQSSEKRCPKCQGAMDEVDGKFGRWARCLQSSCGGRADAAKLSDESCPKCRAPMIDRGDYLSCSQFPTCRCNIDKAALAKAKKKELSCPKCKGLLLEKKGPRGKFLGCARYPQCSHTEPVGSRKKAAHV